MNGPALPARLLHLHSSFSSGGKELRAARLMNAFGVAAQHTLVSGVKGAMDALGAIDPAVAVTLPDNFPPLTGRPWPWRLFALARAMQGFDLVLSYNWGAMDAVMAHRLFARILDLPPLVHHEDGFNQDEAERLNPLRNAYRRLALGGSAQLIVPSQRLARIARDAWAVPEQRITRIVNGIALAAYAGAGARAGTIPGGTSKPRGRRWVGTLAGLRAVKNLPRLVRAFAAMPKEWELVIFGEGPERGAIMAQAEQLGLADRVHLPGFAADPAAAAGLFDLFALSSDSEQFPVSVVEAMASGLAVVSPAVGDVADMVAPSNRAWIVPPGDEAALARALAEAAADPDLRRAIGQDNRAAAFARFDEADMVAAYRQVYARAAGQAVLG